MTCPLCGGPLHVEGAERFLCERGHAMDAEQMRVAVGTQVTMALWSSIEALQSEAEGLRVLAATGRGGSDLAELAERADRDALMLRELVAAHLPPDHQAGG